MGGRGVVVVADDGPRGPGGSRTSPLARSAPQPENRRGQGLRRFLRWSYVASAVVLIGAFAVYARYGVRCEGVRGRSHRHRHVARNARSRDRLSVQIPFGIVDLWWQRRHDVSELGYVEWFFLNWFALGGEFLFVCLALLIVMGLAGLTGNWWWIPGASCSSASRRSSPSYRRT